MLKLVPGNRVENEMFGNCAVSVGVMTCGLLLGATSVASAAPTLYRVTDLGGLNGASSSGAYSVNSSGQVIGYSIGADGARAVLWQPGGVSQDLGVFAGGAYSYGLGLNDAGQAVGYGHTGSAQLGFARTRIGGGRSLIS